MRPALQRIVQALCHAAECAGPAVKSTHGSGFCNLNIFLAHSRQYAKGAGTELVFINTPT